MYNAAVAKDLTAAMRALLLTLMNFGIAVEVMSMPKMMIALINSIGVKPREFEVY